MASRWYQTRYVHRRSPRSTDTGPDVELSPKHLESRRALAKAFRDARLLNAGETISHFRLEQGKIVAFPAHSIWHSVVLTPREMSAEEKPFWWVVVSRFNLVCEVFEGSRRSEAERGFEAARRKMGSETRLARAQAREPKVGDLFSPCELCGDDASRREGSNCWGCGRPSQMGS